ncbi:MAG: hypothetical protein V1784_06855, partial [bacterium]
LQDNYTIPNMSEARVIEKSWDEVQYGGSIYGDQKDGGIIEKLWRAQREMLAQLRIASEALLSVSYGNAIEGKKVRPALSAAEGYQEEVRSLLEGESEGDGSRK